MPRRCPSPTVVGPALCGACYPVAGYLAFRLVPAPVTLGRELADPQRWIAEYGADAATAGIAAAMLWLCAAWVAIGLTAMYLSLLPGLAGRCGSAVARRVVPAAVRRLIIAATGATVLLSPLPAVAAGVPTPAVPAPSWPVGQSSAGQPPATPAPGWPISQPPNATSPSKPVHRVTVVPGDSLWTIAADALGPAATEQRIAVAWPYWYRHRSPSAESWHIRSVGSPSTGRTPRRAASRPPCSGCVRCGWRSA